MMVRHCNRPSYLQVDHLLIVRWTAKQASANDSFEALLKSKKKADSAGQLIQLKEIKDASFATFELREQGILVHTFMIVLKTLVLLLIFCAKSFTVQCSTVKRFVKAHSRFYRMGMHMLQQAPMEVEGEAATYCICYLVAGINCDRSFVIIMDQTRSIFQ
jgi:hypothetical protein